MATKKTTKPAPADPADAARAAVARGQWQRDHAKRALQSWYLTARPVVERLLESTNGLVAAAEDEGSPLRPYLDAETVNMIAHGLEEAASALAEFVTPMWDDEFTITNPVEYMERLPPDPPRE